MEKLGEQQSVLEDKLLAEGTITGYRHYTSLIHSDGQQRTEDGSRQVLRAMS